MEYILKAYNRPNPFLLFGPPGTGKTRTLVGAIEEIIRTTNKCVLVCANSNSACDELTERLLNVLTPEEIHRMYAKSFDKEKVSSKIQPICNINGEKFQMPSLEYLNQFRVVVCTLITAGSIVRARNKDSSFSSDHFSYIFIDEAASCQETISLIAIAG